MRDGPAQATARELRDRHCHPAGPCVPHPARAQGQKPPEVISLDRVKCEALGATSLSLYLSFVYGGTLPHFATVRPLPLLGGTGRAVPCCPACLIASRCSCLPTAVGLVPRDHSTRCRLTASPCTPPTPVQPGEAVELLRLAAFFSNTALAAQLCAWLGGQLAGWEEGAVLEAFRAAVDLGQRHLVAECLAHLLPQFGRCTAEGTGGCSSDGRAGPLACWLAVAGASPAQP